MRYSLEKTLSLLVFGCTLLATSAMAAPPAGLEVADEADLLSLSLSSDALSVDEMGAARGAAGITTISSAQSLAAATSGNTLNVGGDLTNGQIGVGDNFGGFGSYVMNTGNNSTINSAISLNVQIMPSP